jgi:para-aminobenzoate synthetase component 1
VVRLAGRSGTVARWPAGPGTIACDDRTMSGSSVAIPSQVHVERLPGLDSLAPIDVAEQLRGLPGLVLLETARPSRRERWSYLSVDPLVVLAAPAPGPDPFVAARAELTRMSSDRPGADGPPFLGGLVGYLAYDLGAALERLPHRVPDDQGLPTLRLALHDTVIAWDRWTGRAWLGGRAVDGDSGRLGERLGELRERALEAPGAPAAAHAAAPAHAAAHAAAPAAAGDDLVFTSSMSRDRYQRAVGAIRSAIARGDIYQANLARRLETVFSGDPWPLYRRLRTGDPALLSGYLDLGPARGEPDAARRAILSASPEPFLALSADGVVTTDPIKGTRPRGRSRDEDRALARELLDSGKDRAENVMIVDVLRNDLGRVCRPGSVRVPRLCRLERTASVQHLVSTVTGVLADGCDAFDLLAASFPGGSITGAPKLRAIELLEDLEPVRRGPYTGALGWLGPDGAMRTSILIRTLVADGRRLTLHVGGGITWRSDPGDEWDETVAKARGPVSAIGGREVERPLS